MPRCLSCDVIVWRRRTVQIILNSSKQVSAQEFLVQVGRHLTDATTDPWETTFLFQRLSVAIQWFNAACLADTGWPLSSHYQIPWLFQNFKWILFTKYRPFQQRWYRTKCMLFLTAILIYTVRTMTTVFFSRLQWNNSLFLPSPPLEVGPLKSSYGVWGVL